MSIERRRQYQCLHYHLRMAHVMLLCAEESEPGPGRISPLWCASGRLDNARRYAVIFKLNMHRRIARLLRRHEALARAAGEGERRSVRLSRARFTSSAVTPLDNGRSAASGCIDVNVNLLARA